jgi:flagellar basal-body rod modification protein FlgD
MSVSSVSLTPSASPSQQTDQTNQPTSPGQTLDQNDFLQLLVAQLSQQDPMNPVSDTDFAAQMAQFTALQETQTMQGNMAGIQANGLLGQTVQLQPTQGSPITGVVSSVDYSDSTPSLIVDGQPYTLSQVLSVSPTPTDTAGSTPAQTPATAPSN